MMNFNHNSATDRLDSDTDDSSFHSPTYRIVTDSPTEVEYYPVLYESEPNKTSADNNRVHIESSVNESGYNSYCNHSHLSTDEVYQIAQTAYRGNSLQNEPEKQFCGNNTCQLGYVSRGYSHNTANGVEYTNNASDAASAIASIVNKENIPNYNSLSEFLATAIRYNYTPQVCNTYAPNPYYQHNVTSTPDTKIKNAGQQYLERNHHVLWSNQASNQYNQPTSDGSETAFISGTGNEGDSSFPSASTSLNLFTDSHLNQLVCKKAFVQRMMALQHQTSHNTEISHKTSHHIMECRTAPIEGITSSTETENSESFIGPWHRVEKFYGGNNRWKTDEVYHSDIKSSEDINMVHRNPVTYNENYGTPSNSQTQRIACANVSAHCEASLDTSLNINVLHADCNTKENVPTFHSIPQSSGDYSNTDETSNPDLISASTSTVFQAPLAECSNQMHQNEGNYDYDSASWKQQNIFPQGSGICISEIRIKLEDTGKSDTSVNALASTSFDMSTLQPEYNESSADGSTFRENEFTQEASSSISSSVIRDQPLKRISRMRSSRFSRCSYLNRNRPLNSNAVDIMEDWYLNHEDKPYPSTIEKQWLAANGGITVMQVNSWFANRRTRASNTRPKKNRVKLFEQIYELSVELESLSQGRVKALAIQERIGEIINEYLK
uniref:Homeobox domain-containing protein n=1 Tax=Trichobilharzia regenti TaxID=157069 RepID=A0AA85K794_TRIRE|nr:unnamed protein product [Trichobilharzia regenti]